jgi:RNA polymerase sigma-70 factor (ECF subfamily)
MKFARSRSSGGLDLDEFVRSHQADVWHYLRACGCDAHTAEDLTQETFVVVLRKGPVLGRRARAYLRRTARLLFLEAWRRQRVEPLEGGDAWLDAVDRAWEPSGASSNAWLEALRHCCARLEGRRRRIVELFYGELLGREAVAVQLDMTENGVKTALQRIRADLRECIQRKLS